MYQPKEEQRQMETEGERAGEQVREGNKIWGRGTQREERLDWGFTRIRNYRVGGNNQTGNK